MLDKALAAAERMGMLIDDLLGFAKLSRQPVRRAPVSLDDIAARVLQQQLASNAPRAITVERGALGECQGDASLLEQVFVNLLSNACKFTRQQETARIALGAEQHGTEKVYFVRDNGAGFDMRYASKLFGVFQRLHTTSQFEGTGVGLSIVQRIVQRHGGRLWAEAAVGKGAAFFFTLP